MPLQRAACIIFSIFEAIHKCEKCNNKSFGYLKENRASHCKWSAPGLCCLSYILLVFLKLFTSAKSVFCIKYLDNIEEQQETWEKMV